MAVAAGGGERGGRGGVGEPSGGRRGECWVMMKGVTASVSQSMMSAFISAH